MCPDVNIVLKIDCLFYLICLNRTDQKCLVFLTTDRNVFLRLFDKNTLLHVFLTTGQRKMFEGYADFYTQHKQSFSNVRVFGRSLQACTVAEI